MILLKILWWGTLALLQFAVVYVGYCILDLVLYFGVSHESDPLFVLFLVMLWDRLFGPSARLIRDVGKTLYRAKHQEED